MRRRGGFTLIELLIGIALMVMLLLAVTLIFQRTTEVVALNEARTTVYTNARYALDTMENDLLGCLPLDWAPLPIPGVQGQVLSEPSQIFWMENGQAVGPGIPPQMNVGGGHHEKSADQISFRSTTTVADTLQSVQVTYKLIPSNMVLDSTGATTSGDQTHKETARSNRGIFTLVRQLRAPDPNNPRVWSKPVRVRVRGSGSEEDVPDQELCHYVISFNIEYLASNQAFSQLDPSPCPSTKPLGDQQDENDTAGTAIRIPAIRITLVIVEDTAERSERTIQKVMWIPQG
jgi:prepilin-type N-terminal cleavage/methylation domain-containing protein